VEVWALGVGVEVVLVQELEVQELEVQELGQEQVAVVAAVVEDSRQ